MNRVQMFSRMGLTIAYLALVASGCGIKKNRVQPVPEPPQKAAIESAIQSYENHKKNGDVAVPIGEYKDSLRMLAKTWGNYEYAKKEQAKMAVKFEAQVKASKVDLQVSETQRADAEAMAEKHRRHFWYAVGAGVVAAVLGIIVGGLAF